MVIVMISELSAMGRYLDPGGWDGGGGGRGQGEEGRRWGELQEKRPGTGLAVSQSNSSLPLCPYKPPNLGKCCTIARIFTCITSTFVSSDETNPV